MSLFVIYGANQTGQVQKFFYDNTASTLSTEDGTPIAAEKSHGSYLKPEIKTREIGVSATSPGRKSRQIMRLKIQLGLACNYNCSYCAQRSSVKTKAPTREDALRFIHDLPNWYDGGEDSLGCGTSIEFWGGEPFVYWQVLRQLAEGIKQQYPNATLSVITNGSLLTHEINQWLDQMGFIVSISHDGPGQSERGPDPFDDPVQKEIILDLFHRLRPKDKFSFNPMMHAKNASRREILTYFQKVTGIEDVPLGEGSFIDIYDEESRDKALKPDELNRYSRNAFNELCENELFRNVFFTVGGKIQFFIDSIVTGMPADKLSQKCSMDSPHRIAVDLEGNVLTCQNVSAKSFTRQGKSHKIGHISEPDKISLDTATHWSHRNNCAKCPVLFICGGGCMSAGDEYFDLSCENFFADCIPLFAYAFELITGYRPFRIDGGLEERTAIWDIKPIYKPKPTIRIRSL